MIVSPCADDAADGVDGELVHDAGLRRADVDPLQLILGGGEALPQLGDLAFGLAQIPQHFGAEILVELDDLQLGFADPAAGAGDVGAELAVLAFAVSPGRAAAP